MRLLALILTISVTGPSVASLVCTLACAVRHQMVSAAGRCHEHGTDAATPTIERGPQCHTVSAPAPSVLRVSPQLHVARAVVVTSPAMVLTAQPLARLTNVFHDPAQRPPPPLIPLRI